MKIEEVNNYRFQVRGMGAMPIVFHLSSDLLPDQEALDQLRGVAQAPGIFDHVAVLSDVHPKEGRKCPTGVAAASDFFLPQIMDTAPNCGMRMFSLPLKEKDLSQEQIDKIFRKLIKEVPTKKYIGTRVSKKTLMDICRKGTRGLLESGIKGLEFINNEIENTFKEGNEFDNIPEEEEIRGVIPNIFLNMARYRLGILGTAGNHFLDLMKVEEIEDKETAELLGIEKSQLIFFMHTGSGILGQYSSYFYTPKKEEHLFTRIMVNRGRKNLPSAFLTGKEIKELQEDSLSFRDKKEFFAIDPKSNKGKAYFTAHQASANFGFANRAVLTAKVKRTVEGVLKKKFDWRLIYDMGHIGVRKEKHLGRNVWVHRNGVSRAYGPKRMKHKIFSQTGEPCFFAGSMTTPSYLAAALDENTSTFFSASHGAGKKKNLPKRSPNKKELFRQVEKRNVRLYNAKSRGVVKQSSDYYKDINKVMEGVEKNRIAKPVAKLTPIAVLMA